MYPYLWHNRTVGHNRGDQLIRWFRPSAIHWTTILGRREFCILLQWYIFRFSLAVTPQPPPPPCFHFRGISFTYFGLLLKLMISVWLVLVNSMDVIDRRGSTRINRLLLGVCHFLRWSHFLKVSLIYLKFLWYRNNHAIKKCACAWGGEEGCMN